MNSISTFDITQYPLLDILKDIKTGRIQLPDFQLLDSLELEVLKKFEHYQMPVIQLRDSLPKEAVCQVFEDTNTSCRITLYLSS
jgi:hypothetical protein